MAVFFLLLTGFKLLYEDWRGYLLGLRFALVWVANQYMSVYNRLRLDIKQKETEVEQQKVCDAPNAKGGHCPPSMYLCGTTNITASSFRPLLQLIQRSQYFFAVLLGIHAGIDLHDLPVRVEKKVLRAASSVTPKFMVEPYACDTLWSVSAEELEGQAFLGAELLVGIGEFDTHAQHHGTFPGIRS